jgi:O-antigen/teichoic acid export membrane protein
MSSSSLGSDASRVVLGRGMLYTAGTAAPVLSNALATPFVTRTLDTRSFGIVSVCLVIIQVGMIVAGFGLAASITRHGILEQSGVGGARSLVLRGASMSAALCVVAALTATWWFPDAAPGELRSVQLALLAAAGFAVVVNAQSYLRVLDRPGPFVALSVTGALGGPVIGLALLWTTQATATRYLLGLAIGYVVAATAALILIATGGARTRATGDLRKALRIGLPTVPHQVALYLASGVLVLVATAVDGAAASGRVQVAVLVGSAPGVITASLNNAWAPVIYRTPEHQRGEVLAHTSRDIAVLTALAAGFVALAAPFLLRLVAPPSYNTGELMPSVAFVAAATILSVPYLSNVHLVFVSGRSTGLAVITPFSLAIGSLAAWAAATAIGLPATTVGMTVTYAFLALCTALLARRVSTTRWNSRVLWAPIGTGFALCLVGAVLPADGWALAVRAALAVLTTVAAGLALLRLRKA